MSAAWEKGTVPFLEYPRTQKGTVPFSGRSALYTRREVGKLALAAVPFGRAFFQRPDSKIAGVQIGLNVPYSFGSNALSGEETLERCVKLGVSAVELRSQPVEAFLGVPADLVNRIRRGA